MYEQQGLSGLGRSSGQTAFDSGRQKLWEQFTGLASWSQPLTVDLATRDLATINQIMDAHTALYKSLQGQVDNSWLAPRYNDLQTQYENRKRELTQWLASQNVNVTPLVTGAPTVQVPLDLSQPTQLVISGSGPATALVPGSAGGSAAIPMGSAYGDIYGPEAPSGSQGAGGLDLGALLPWAVGGLALAFLLRRR